MRKEKDIDTGVTKVTPVLSLWNSAKRLTPVKMAYAAASTIMMISLERNVKGLYIDLSAI